MTFDDDQADPPYEDVWLEESEEDEDDEDEDGKKGKGKKGRRS